MLLASYCPVSHPVKDDPTSVINSALSYYLTEAGFKNVPSPPSTSRCHLLFPPLSLGTLIASLHVPRLAQEPIKNFTFPLAVTPTIATLSRPSNYTSPFLTLFSSQQNSAFLTSRTTRGGARMVAQERHLNLDHSCFISMMEFSPNGRAMTTLTPFKL